MMTKSGGMKSCPILIRTSSKILIRYFIDRSDNCRDMFVALISPMSSFLQIERGIQLTLVRRLQRAISKFIVQITQGIEKKILVSLSLGDNLFWIMTLHSPVSATILLSSSFHLLDTIYLKYVM